MTGVKNKTEQRGETKMTQDVPRFSSLPFTSTLALSCAKKKKMTNLKASVVALTDFHVPLLWTNQCSRQSCSLLIH